MPAEWQVVILPTFLGQRRVFDLGAVNIKEEAQRLIEKLPDDATWDDVMHEIYVRQLIEAGITDSEAGRLTSVKDIRFKE